MKTSLVLVTILLLAGTGFAETRTLTLSASDAIVSPEGEGRILMKFPSLAGLIVETTPPPSLAQRDASARSETGRQSHE